MRGRPRLQVRRAHGSPDFLVGPRGWLVAWDPVPLRLDDGFGHAGGEVEVDEVIGHPGESLRVVGRVDVLEVFDVADADGDERVVEFIVEFIVDRRR